MIPLFNVLRSQIKSRSAYTRNAICDRIALEIAQVDRLRTKQKRLDLLAYEYFKLRRRKSDIADGFGTIFVQRK